MLICIVEMYMSEEMYSLGLCIMRNQVPVDSVVHISWFRLGPTVNILCRRFWLYKLDHIQTDQQPFASMTLWLASFDRNIFDNWEYELENWGRKWFFFFFSLICFLRIGSYVCAYWTFISEVTCWLVCYLTQNVSLLPPLECSNHIY